MSRSEEVAQERRRRQPGTLDRMQQMKLVIPEAVREKYPDDTFRFINDDGNRIYDMTVRDDWTKVDESLSAPVPVGTDKFNKPIMAYLCRKRKDYAQADRNEMLTRLRDEEKAIMKGQHKDSDALAEGDSYIPEGAKNTISTAFTP